MVDKTRTWAGIFGSRIPKREMWATLISCRACVTTFFLPWRRSKSSCCWWARHIRPGSSRGSSQRGPWSRTSPWSWRLLFKFNLTSGNTYYVIWIHLPWTEEHCVGTSTRECTWKGWRSGWRGHHCNRENNVLRLKLGAVGNYCNFVTYQHIEAFHLHGIWWECKWDS